MKYQEKTKEQYINELTKLRQRIAELERLKDKYQQVEEDLKYRERLEKIITTLSTNFISLSLGNIDNGINQALKKIGNFVGVDRSYVFLFSKDRTRMDNTHEWCNRGITPQIDNLKNLSVNIFPWWIEKLRRFEIIHIPRVLELPLEAIAEKKILQSQNIQSLIVVPMICNKYLVGYLGFDSVREEKIWPEDIILLLKIVGEILANALERKQARDNLKNAKDELEMIMDSVPALIFYKDTEGRIIRANKTLANLLKIPVKDIIGKTADELVPREQAENMKKDDQEVIISGKPKRDIIEPYDTPEGTRWAITDKIPYKDKKGKVTGVISLSKDITVQKKSEEELQQSYQKLKKTIDAAIDTMSRIIEAKDSYTSGHQHRVCQLAVPLARELGLSPDKIEGIRIASLIHDIGKIGLPAEILSKPAKLTDIEFSLIKGHSQIGYDILKSIDFSYPVAQIALQHHERLDGSGYPNNLKGDEILLEAKIIGVADVVEAMSSFRPYRPALGIDAALEEISKNKGILYDPEVVDACIRLVREKGFKFKS